MLMVSLISVGVASNVEKNIFSMWLVFGLPNEISSKSVSRILYRCHPGPPRKLTTRVISRLRMQTRNTRFSSGVGLCE